MATRKANAKTEGSKSTFATKKTSKSASKVVNNLIIVDESGSMSIIRQETLAGLNETIATCQQMQKNYPEMEQRITLITFDSSQCHIHFDNVLASEAFALSADDYVPGGGTPLYDAIGYGVSKLNAMTKQDAKVLVTIITDGEENCSNKFSLDMVKNLIDKLKTQGWTFALIGTDNLDVENMASEMSIDNHLKFAEDEKSTREMFKHEREARVVFNKCCATETVMESGSYFNDKE